MYNDDSRRRSNRQEPTSVAGHLHPVEQEVGTRMRRRRRLASSSAAAASRSVVSSLLGVVGVIFLALVSTPFVACFSSSTAHTSFVRLWRPQDDTSKKSRLFLSTTAATDRVTAASKTAATAAASAEPTNSPKATTATETSPPPTPQAAQTQPPSPSPDVVFSEELSKIGDWEELHGNYLLRPSLDKGGPAAPRALIHFLGGAFVGAAPHVSYRYLLERLAAAGYLVVATPYDLAFDHLATCDAVIARFERIAAFLARTYGALPVIGVGHSCGALLQVLITSLFPDTPRAANALLSFNNKPVSQAVPFFEEIMVPLFTNLATRNETTSSNSRFPSGNEVLTVSLQLAQATAAGQVPSDQLLTKATQLLLAPLSPAGSSSQQMPTDGAGAGAGVVTVPPPLRNAVETALLKPSTAALTQAGVTPVALQVLRALEQVPRLIDEVAIQGARDFNPPAEQTKAATRRAYRARRTLVLQFTNDPLDESDELQELLTAAGQVAAMKRPDVTIDVQRRDLPGGHAAPLLAPPLELAQRAQDLLGETEAPTQLLYSQADATAKELLQWLEESNL